MVMLINTSLISIPQVLISLIDINIFILDDLSDYNSEFLIVYDNYDVIIISSKIKKKLCPTSIIYINECEN